MGLYRVYLRVYTAAALMMSSNVYSQSLHEASTYMIIHGDITLDLGCCSRVLLWTVGFRDCADLLKSLHDAGILLRFRTGSIGLRSIEEWYSSLRSQQTKLNCTGWSQAFGRHRGPRTPELQTYGHKAPESAAVARSLKRLGCWT